MSKTVMGFDKSGGIALMALHCFSILNNGNLLHEIDGKIRAEVPPEGFEDYAEQWPECKDVISGRVYSLDNGEQNELAKLIGNPDNTVSVPPTDSGEVPPLPPVA